MQTLQVGLAEVDFTPDPGLPLMGNYRTDYAARGTHDPLMAKAMVLADSVGTKAALLAVDLCMVDRDNVALMRQQIGRQCDVPPENVVIAASHTHSAPAPNDRFSFGADFSAYRPATDRMLCHAASAVARAAEQLAPATLRIGYSREDRLAFNRRLRRHDGTTQMNWEALQPGFDPEAIEGAWGADDPRVACLAVCREGRSTAAVVNFALHPAILAGDNWLYSADYPGYLAEAMRRTMEPAFGCLFFNGCCGNLNHVDYRQPQQGRGYPMAQRVGYMLAAAATEAIRRSEPITDTPLRVERKWVELERLPIDEAQRQWCQRVLAESEASRPEGLVDGLPDAHFAQLRLKMYEKQHEPDRVEVMAFRIGDVAIVGLPGEHFCETSLAIREGSVAPHTLVGGLANDAVGYIPTAESFAQGGYESIVGSTFYGEDAAERTIDVACQTIVDLYSA